MTAQQKLEDKDKFIHRDLSWLLFNERVLEEAVEAGNPVLEQGKFVAIFMSNLDEFLMVRYAGLKHLIDAQYNRKDNYGYYPQDVYREVRARVEALTQKAYQVYEEALKPALAKEKIVIRRAS